MPSCPKCGEKVHKAGTGRGGVQRWRCAKDVEGRRVLCWNGHNPVGSEEAKSQGIDAKAVKKLHRKLKDDKREVKRYVITAAQNATPVKAEFLATLLGYCKHQRAQLVVIPYRYKNPTSMWSKKAETDDWWAEELKPYLLDRRWEINKHLVVLADIKVQPTANSPLQGFETISGGKSAIIGHPKLELSTIATPQNRLPKILTTTGAVTEMNYIQSKAGKKGEHHHTFGACVVEQDGNLFHMRQINALRDGTFIDLGWEYLGADRMLAKRAAALVMGDSHVRFIDPLVVKATFGCGGMVELLQPERLVWHDVNDFHSASHHDKGNVMVSFVKHHAGLTNVEKELDQTFKFIDEHTPKNVINVFVPSNHSHDFLRRWINDTDPRQDPENCVFWAKTFSAMCESAHMAKNGEKYIEPFTYWAKRKLKTASQGVFLDYDQSYQVLGVELGMHGHHGANGARGSLLSFGRIGVKSISGHGHSPAIKDGAYRTGTSTYLRLGYNVGLSSWLQTHCVEYANGKRCLLNIIDGEFRA